MNSVDHYVHSQQKVLHKFHPREDCAYTFKPLQPIKGDTLYFIPALLLEIARSIALIESTFIQNIGGTFQYLITLKVKGLDLFQDEVLLTSGTFDFKHLLSLYLKSTVSDLLEEREAALRKLWRALGFDTMNLIGANL